MQENSTMHNWKPEKDTDMPQKKYFRQRAHANPFADHVMDYPVRPEKFDWSTHFPEIRNKNVQFADVGCGAYSIYVFNFPWIT